MRGIIIAAAIEASPFISRLRLVREEGHPFKIYRGENDLLLVTGIGKANCAMGTAYAAVKFGIEKAYNCGAAGALKAGFPIGGIYTAELIYEPDRPVLGSDVTRKFKAEPCPGTDIAVLSTMDRPVLAEKDRSGLSSFADLADMEGAAFVQACLKFRIIPSLLKLVTDIPGSAEQHIFENIKIHSHKLADHYARLHNIS